MRIFLADLFCVLVFLGAFFDIFLRTFTCELFLRIFFADKFLRTLSWTNFFADSSGICTPFQLPFDPPKFIFSIFSLQIIPNNFCFKDTQKVSLLSNFLLTDNFWLQLVLTKLFGFGLLKMENWKRIFKVYCFLLSFLWTSVFGVHLSTLSCGIFLEPSFSLADFDILLLSST